MSRNYLRLQLLDAWHAQYAHAFFLSIFVSVADKGRMNYIPKLEIRVRSPSPAPFFPSNIARHYTRDVAQSLEQFAEELPGVNLTIPSMPLSLFGKTI